MVYTVRGNKMTIGKKIELIMMNNDFSVSQFAKKIGYSRQYVYTLINGKDSRGSESKPQIDTLKQICENTGYDFRTFLEETGYLTPTTQIQKPQSIIKLAPEITEIQKLYNAMTLEQQAGIIGYARGVLSASGTDVSQILA